MTVSATGRSIASLAASTKPSRAYFRRSVPRRTAASAVSSLAPIRRRRTVTSLPRRMASRPLTNRATRAPPTISPSRRTMLTSYGGASTLPIVCTTASGRASTEATGPSGGTRPAKSGSGTPSTSKRIGRCLSCSSSRRGTMGSSSRTAPTRQRSIGCTSWRAATSPRAIRACAIPLTQSRWAVSACRAVASSAARVAIQPPAAGIPRCRLMTAPFAATPPARRRRMGATTGAMPHRQRTGATRARTETRPPPPGDAAGVARRD